MEDGHGEIEDSDFARRALLAEIAKQIVRQSLAGALVPTAIGAAIPF